MTKNLITNSFNPFNKNRISVKFVVKQGCDTLYAIHKLNTFPHRGLGRYIEDGPQTFRSEKVLQ